MKPSLLLLALASCWLSDNVQAGALAVAVKDAHGAAVSDAVVYAEGVGATAQPAKAQAVIDQQSKEFIPYVTAVQVGTAINFPNKDNIRHHVYSLSLAKKFELPLYAGVPAQPVSFDREGFVTLGCNIHDWMIAYVAVLPTPFFHVTAEDGEARLEGLPAGSYAVQVWHPSLQGTPKALAQQVQLPAKGERRLTFVLDLKPNFRPKRAPGLSGEGYR